jgi:hypothetical protein
MGYADAKIVKKSLFIKIEQGIPQTLRLLDGNPTEQWQHKIGEGLKPCTGEMCEMCEAGHSKNQRFVTNIYSHTDQKVYLWSYGPNVAEELKSIALALQKDGIDILDCDLEVSAKGTGLQKKTKVQPRMKSQEIPSGLKLIRIGPKDENDAPF